jgi:hypothetical protein
LAVEKLRRSRKRPESRQGRDKMQQREFEKTRRNGGELSVDDNFSIFQVLISA